MIPEAAPENVAAEEAARRLRDQHPLDAERVERVVALLLSVGASRAVTR